MKIVKEPLNIDFVVENRSLTKEEEKIISDFITSQKSKIELKNTLKRKISKSKQKTT